MKFKKKILIPVLSLALFAGAFSANDSEVKDVKAAEVAGAVAEVKMGTKVTQVTNLVDAIYNNNSRSAYTVKLLQDVEVSTMLKKGLGLKELDFNGFQIRGTEAISTTTDDNFAVMNASAGSATVKFVLKDSSGTGRGGIYCDTGYSIHVGKSSCNLRIEGGNYYGAGSAINVQVGTIDVYGGKFGVRIDDVKTKRDDFVLNRVDNTASTKAIEVFGGEFYNFNPAENAADNTADGSPTNYVVAGYRSRDLDGDGWFTVDKYPVKIGTKYYDNIEDAMKVVESGQTITLCNNLSGNGIVVPSGMDITFDLGGFTYLIDGSTVGSTGTATNGFQLLKDSNITIKNGTIEAGEAVKMLIQNYSNLTLDNVTLVGSAKTSYVLSNNYGNVVLKNKTKISAVGNNCAFDVYYGMSSVYDEGVNVTIEDSTVVIEGHVEYAQASRVDKNEFATDNYSIVMPADYQLELANGLKIVATEDGRSEVVNNSIYLARQFANDWRALRKAGGIDGICKAINTPEMDALLARYIALDAESKEYLTIASDEGICSIAESVTYIQNVMNGSQNTEKEYGIAKEDSGSFMTLSTKEESPYLVAIISLIGVLSVSGYYFYSKKKHA